MTTNNLSEMRSVAGARYAAAVAELWASYVDLSSIDAAINNGNIPVPPVATFRGDADRIPHEFRHPAFYPEGGESLKDARTERFNLLLRQHTPNGTD